MKKRICIALSVIGFIAGFAIAWSLVVPMRNLVIPGGSEFVVITSPMGPFWFFARFSMAAALAIAAIPIAFLVIRNRNHFLIVLSLAPVAAIIAFLLLRLQWQSALAFGKQHPELQTMPDISRIRLENIPLAALAWIVVGAIVVRTLATKQPRQQGLPSEEPKA